MASTVNVINTNRVLPEKSLVLIQTNSVSYAMRRVVSDLSSCE